MKARNILSFLLILAELCDKAFCHKLHPIILRTIKIKGSDKSSNNSQPDFGNGLWDNNGFVVENPSKFSNGLSQSLLTAKTPSFLRTTIPGFNESLLSIKFSFTIGRVEVHEQIVLNETISISPDKSKLDKDVINSTLSETTQSVTAVLVKVPSVDTKLLENSVERKNGDKSPMQPLILQPLKVLSVKDVRPKAVTSSNPNKKQSLPQKRPAAPKAVVYTHEDIRKDGPSYVVLQKSDASGRHTSHSSEPVALVGGGPPKSKGKEESGEIMILTKEQITKPEREKRDVEKVHEVVLTSASGKPKSDTDSKEASSDADVEEEDAEETTKSPKKLEYGTWKASQDKSFRPPGFYLLVNEKVVFDNRGEVWPSWENPAIMGRCTPSPKNKDWNMTEILVQFQEEEGEKDLKISLEWEPSDEESHQLFLADLSIFTYGYNASSLEPTVRNSSESATTTPPTPTNSTITAGTTNKPDNQTSNGGHQNLTVVIVLQTSNNTAGQPITVHLDNGNTASAQSSIKEQSSNSSSASGKVTESHSTPLVVLCITGVLGIILLAFLIHKKVQLSRRPNCMHR